MWERAPSHTMAGKPDCRAGVTVFRSELLDEAGQLAALGPEAVPALADWADHTNTAIRSVAVNALRQITGLLLEVAYFDETWIRAAHERAPLAPGAAGTLIG